MREEIQNLIVSIEQININLMIADPLTKALDPKTSKEHVCKMGSSYFVKGFLIETL